MNEDGCCLWPQPKKDNWGPSCWRRYMGEWEDYRATHSGFVDNPRIWRGRAPPVDETTRGDVTIPGSLCAVGPRPFIICDGDEYFIRYAAAYLEKQAKLDGKPLEPIEIDMLSMDVKSSLEFKPDFKSGESTAIFECGEDE